jgi:[ribosomal protein S18]-alanine N-acetyltransferase
MPEFVIEPLRSPTDLDDVLAIETESFTNPWTREMYESEMTKAGVSHFLLARDRAGQALGFCSFWRVVDEVHVNNLAVRPSHRRRGIGRALLMRALDEARALGATRALLEVRRSNDEAKRLYESLGFTVAGIRKQYYSQPVEDAIVLWREHLERLVPASRG